MPSEAFVEAIFLATIPDLPTPENITLTLHLIIKLTILSKSLLIDFFNF